MSALPLRLGFAVLSKSRTYYLLQRQVSITYFEHSECLWFSFPKFIKTYTKAGGMFQVNEIGPYLLLIFPLMWRKAFKILKRLPLPDPPTPCPVWSLSLDHMLWPALLLWSGWCLARLLPGPGRSFERGSAEGRAFQVRSVLTGTHATTPWGVLLPQRGRTGPDAGQGPYRFATTAPLLRTQGPSHSMLLCPLQTRT